MKKNYIVSMGYRHYEFSKLSDAMKAVENFDKAVEVNSCYIESDKLVEGEKREDFSGYYYTERVPEEVSLKIVEGETITEFYYNEINSRPDLSEIKRKLRRYNPDIECISDNSHPDYSFSVTDQDGPDGIGFRRGKTEREAWLAAHEWLVGEGVFDGN